MTHQLPSLPFKANDLAPAISETTVGFHYGKHHQAYLNNLNNLIPGTPYENMPLTEIIVKAPAGPVFNNAAQVFNHTFYFDQFKPSVEAKKRPENELLKALEKHFGSFEKFIEEFSGVAATVFGSGWAWLVVEKDRSLAITKESNAGCPLTHGQKPLLTCDVWEHAYYLDYQNRRPDYIKAFWAILDWEVIENRFVE
ncbi:MAG: superoxide dismutase [Bacteroidales bacterium]|nr:superoxide dismutase [Bacteroidales bacterium]